MKIVNTRGIIKCLIITGAEGHQSFLVGMLSQKDCFFLFFFFFFSFFFFFFFVAKTAPTHINLVTWESYLFVHVL